MKWNLQFISQQNYKNHVKHYYHLINSETQATNLREFNRNIIDPIKMTFTYFITNEDPKFLIESELNRQVDKSINNHIGYFHQNIFKYINGWHVPKEGFDIVNDNQTVFVELKNKHNTMNSSSSQRTYIKLQSKLIESLEKGIDVKCLLVEVIARRSQNIKWEITLDGKRTSHPSIRRVSIDKFYELATGDPYAFQKILSWFPITLKEIVLDENKELKESILMEELTKEKSFFKNLYSLAFETYQGFDEFEFVGVDLLGNDF